MAPVPVTEDYYLVLEVEHTATYERINQSYKRLARKVHPDKNLGNQNATREFQMLGRAYETLKDESKRRAYDFLYPSIKQAPSSPHTTQPPRQPPASSAQSTPLDETAQIAALQKSKQERAARWWTKKNAFDSSIFELQRDIRRLEQAMNNLDCIVAAEAAEEAKKNSWGTWLLSSIYKKVEDSEEDKALKERGRQERRIEKDMKERRMRAKKTELKKEEDLLKKAKDEVDAADLIDDRKIRVILDKRRAREEQERRERERVENERLMKILKQQQEEREKRQRAAAETLRKQQAEARAAELKRQAEERIAEQRRQEEDARRWQKIVNDLNRGGGTTSEAYNPECRHKGWWPKVELRAACPKCHDVWNYLLQCPSCGMEACPKCQAVIQGRRLRSGASSNRRAPPVRTPSPDFSYDYYDY